LLKEPLPHQIT